MVTTRGRYRQYCEENPLDFDSQVSYVYNTPPGSECESCSQHSEASSHYEFEHDVGPGDEPYSNNDHCKRHRKPDGEDKTEEVVSYKRRKPRS